MGFVPDMLQYNGALPVGTTTATGKDFGDVAQLGERRVRNAKVEGSTKRSLIAWDAGKPRIDGGPETHAFQDGRIEDAIRSAHNPFISSMGAVK